jgi:uncharacterized membrane protein YhaH (DUF805 family)
MIAVAAAFLAILVVAFTLGVHARALPPPEPVSPFRHLEQRRAVIYENLRDLQFEYRLAKLSDADYQQTKRDLQRELAVVLAEIDSAALRHGASGTGAAATPKAEESLWSFQGRLARGSFWDRFLALQLAGVGAAFVTGTIAAASRGGAIAATALYVAFVVVAGWIGLATQVRRWHDLGRSGWMVLSCVAILPLIVVGCVRGTKGPNQYGSDPLDSPEGAGGRPAPNQCPHCAAKFPQPMKFCGECGKAMLAEAR